MMSLKNILTHRCYEKCSIPVPGASNHRFTEGRCRPSAVVSLPPLEGG